MQSHAARIKQLFGPEKLPGRSRNKPLEQYLLTTARSAQIRIKIWKRRLFLRLSHPVLTWSAISGTEKKLVFENGFQSGVFLKTPTRSRSAPARCYLFLCGRRKRRVLECHTSYSLQRMPCEECYRISIICFLKISVWTGQNDFKAVLVDAYFFKI